MPKQRLQQNSGFAAAFIFLRRSASTPEPLLLQADRLSAAAAATGSNMWEFLKMQPAGNNSACPAVKIQCTGKKNLQVFIYRHTKTAGNHDKTQSMVTGGG
jgi:hypothetical protein